MVNNILAFILLIAGNVLAALGFFGWAIWLGIIAIWAMGHYIASKIDELEKKIDNNNKS